MKKFFRCLFPAYVIPLLFLNALIFADDVFLTLGTSYWCRAAFLGANDNFVRGDRYFNDPKIQFPLKDMKFRAMRYSGGTVSSYWDYQNDTFVDYDRLYDFLDSQGDAYSIFKDLIDANPPGVFGHKRFYSDIAAADQWFICAYILNVATRTPEQSLADLNKIIADNAYNPGQLIIELDNELYFNEFKNVLWPVAEYPDACKQAEAYIDENSMTLECARNAGIALVGAPNSLMATKDYKYLGSTTWLAGLTNKKTQYDGLALHDYGLDDIFIDGFSEDWQKRVAFVTYGMAAYSNIYANMKRHFNYKSAYITEYNTAYWKSNVFLLTANSSFLCGLSTLGRLIAACNYGDVIKGMFHHGLWHESSAYRFGFVKQDTDGTILLNCSGQIAAHFNTIYRMSQKITPAFNNSPLAGITVYGQTPRRTSTLFLTHTDPARDDYLIILEAGTGDVVKFNNPNLLYKSMAVYTYRGEEVWKPEGTKSWSMIDGNGYIPWIDGPMRPALKESVLLESQISIDSPAFSAIFVHLSKQ
ncbi:MAG TPA: hypothetical protein DC049_05785 [Spirochaetia bacterium]|nr:hypothetical protein [Spirochaetia bacterium]